MIKKGKNPLDQVREEKKIDLTKDKAYLAILEGLNVLEELRGGNRDKPKKEKKKPKKKKL